MDKVEEILINGLYSNGSSTFFGFAYAIFYFFKQRVSSESSELIDRPCEVEN